MIHTPKLRDVTLIYVSVSGNSPRSDTIRAPSYFTSDGRVIIILW